MAQLIFTRLGLRIEAWWVAPVIGEGDTVQSPAYIAVEVNSEGEFKAFDLPAESADDARRPCGLDLVEFPDGSIVIVYNLADTDEIIRMVSTDGEKRVWTPLL